MKYLHIFNCKNGGFFDRVISSIRDNEIFDSNEHYFLIRNTEKYNSIKNKENVILDLEQGSLVEKYENQFDAFILHSLDSLDEPHQIPKKLRKKVFWRTWGHDAGYNFVFAKRIDVMIKKDIRYLRQRREVNQFAGIGIANVVDELDMKKKYGKHAKTYRFPYINNIQIDQAYNGNNLNNKKIKILVGHSGFSNDMHIQSLEKLVPVKNDVEIFIPLVYGNKDYIDKVVAYANEHFGDSVHYLFDKLDFDSYCKLLSEMNFAFFPCSKSYALGNINIALSYSVNLVIDKNGLIGKAFAKENIPFIDFNSFNASSDLCFKTYDISKTNMRSRTLDERIQDLKQVFDLLRK